MLSYAILSFIYQFSCSGELQFFNILFDEKANKLPWDEIIFATLIAILLSFISALAFTRNWISRLGNFLRVTQGHVNSSVWNIFLDSQELTWVFIRDHKLDLTYYGWIAGYSDEDEEYYELLIKNVSIFSNIGDNISEPLYERPYIYILRNKDDITIEQPDLPIEKKPEKNNA